MECIDPSCIQGSPLDDILKLEEEPVPKPKRGRKPKLGGPKTTSFARRLQNRLAARRCREKKRIYYQDLENRVCELEYQNELIRDKCLECIETNKPRSGLQLAKELISLT